MAKYNEQKAMEKFVEEAKHSEQQFVPKEQRMVELEFNENDEVVERKMGGPEQKASKQKAPVTSAIVVNLGDEAYTHGTSLITPNMFDTRDKTANAHNFIQNLERTQNRAKKNDMKVIQENDVAS